MTSKQLSELYSKISVACVMLSLAFAFACLPLSRELSDGKYLWVPITSGAFLLLGLIFCFAYCGDWFLGLVDKANKKKEEEKKEQEAKEKEFTYLEDFDYDKLAEEKAYLNDFNGPKDIEPFLVMLKRRYPQLNWVEAVYVTYLVGRHHEQMYRN